MSAHISRAIGVLTFTSAILTLGAPVAPNMAFAADCLTTPSPSTPPNSHWYYRTDRTQQRKCWFLRADNEASGRKPAAADKATLGEPPVSSAKYSLSSFKEFMAQRTGVAPSDQDVEKLYAAFLEWNRRAKN
jgi:hypothetical protein